MRIWRRLRNYDATVVKMVDFSYNHPSTTSQNAALNRAAAPTVQDGSARESHPETPS